MLIKGFYTPFSASEGVDPMFPGCAPGARTTGALGVVGFVDPILPDGTSGTSSGSMVLSRRGVAELIAKA